MQPNRRDFLETPRSDRPPREGRLS